MPMDLELQRLHRLTLDLLEVSSLQRFVSHLTEIHVAVVVALFPSATHTHTFILIVAQFYISSTVQWGDKHVLFLLFTSLKNETETTLSVVCVNTANDWKSISMTACVYFPTFRHGGASRSVVSRKQLSDDFLFEPWRKRKQNWVSPRQPGNAAERKHSVKFHYIKASRLTVRSMFNFTLSMIYTSVNYLCISQSASCRKMLRGLTFWLDTDVVAFMSSGSSWFWDKQEEEVKWKQEVDDESSTGL